YHLGLMQMHELDANSSAQAQLVREVDEHLERMRGLGIEPDQTRLDPGWVEALKVR
ncbi:DUF3087 family protein, partial [Pseudomonas sp. Bout1]